MKNTSENKQNGLQKVMLTKTASIISGIVCAIPFVFEKTFFLSFIMYVPLFYMFYNSEKIKVLPRVFLYGFGYYVTGYSFLCELYPLDFAGFNKLEAFGVIAFALTAVPLIHSALLSACFAFCLYCTRMSADVIKLAAFPCIIVLNEYLQTLGPLAFPWCRVSIAQGSFLPFLQSASLFGSYFTAYIVVLINGLIAYAVIKPEMKKIPLIIAVAVFVTNLSFGVIRLAFSADSKESFTAVSLQGNISSSEKWSGSVSDMLDIYLELTEEALETAEKKGMSENIIAVMPETALPITLSENSKLEKRISEYADEKNISFIAGAFSDAGDSSGNALFMFDENGKMSKPYNKQILVPFGEYVPYRDVFTAIVPALGEINMLSEDLYKGEDSCIFETEAGKAGGVICYESVFPSLCRETVNDGAEILLVSTNDSWFGSSAALKHHLVASRVRATENGVPVIRAANTGISAVIDRYGAYEKTLGANKRGFVIAELSKSDGRTLYSYVGDTIVGICFAFVGFAFVKSRIKHK